MTAVEAMPAMTAVEAMTAMTAVEAMLAKQNLKVHRGVNGKLSPAQGQRPQ